MSSGEPGGGGFPLPIVTPPMEARLEDDLPADGAWQFEPKWDGFRCLAFRQGDKVDLRAKAAKPLSRSFPEVIAALCALKADRFVIDGELAILTAEGVSFSGLQMRLHPAESRIRKLAVETPATFILFDILAAGDALFGHLPLRKRRARAEAFRRKAGHGGGLLQLSPTMLSRGEAQGWLRASGGAIDGVVAKPLDEPYRFGERAMIKVKCLRTADCVVGGFRYGTGSDEIALLLGLYNEDGKLDHVGFTSTIARADRAALTKRLEALIEPPGFTGNAPGGPSRWSTERSAEWQPSRPELVVEARYDHVSDDRFRLGTKLLRWRPDKAPRQCTFEQIAPKRTGARTSFSPGRAALRG